MPLKTTSKFKRGRIFSLIVALTSGLLISRPSMGSSQSGNCWSRSDAMAARRLAVVTGGNKGIGFQVAKQLQESGLRVVIACRNRALAEKAASSLGCESELLDLASDASIEAFASVLESKYGQLDVLVNNAAIAFKAADPTPFRDQTVPTLAINFYATMRLTDRLLPLLRAGRTPRVVNVASMAGKLKQLSPDLQQQFSAPTLDRQTLTGLVEKFVADVQAGRHREQGWSNSNYGLSKLALVAYTRLLAREEGATMRVNACCPGYCSTDMSSNRGGQPAEVGARTVATCALLPDGAPNGAFWEHERESVW